MLALEREFNEVVDTMMRIGYYPTPPIVESAATEPEIIINRKKVLLFASNNYFGMSANIKVKKAMIDAVKKYGMGSGGPRLFAGNLDVHVGLERIISEYLHKEACITFTTGYMGNVGIIPALLNPYVLQMKENRVIGINRNEDVTVFSDEYNHGSIVDGIRLANAECIVYKHCDTIDLEKKIKKVNKNNKVIITDGVFSMEGDVAPLPQICEISKKYGCLVMIDDAHAIGVFGKRGLGTVEHFGINPEDVYVTLGTFTKAFGGIGGFVVGKKKFIDYLRVSARTYILSAPLPPAVSAGLTVSVSLVRDGDNLRKLAWENARYFKKSIKEIGYETTNSDSLIVPVIIGEESKSLVFTKELYKMGIYAPPARFPAVPMGRSRMRFVFTSQHQKGQIDYLLNCLQELFRFLK